MLVSRDLADPLYPQIKEYWASEIDSGHHQPDQRFPYERELSN